MASIWISRNRTRSSNSFNCIRNCFFSSCSSAGHLCTSCRIEGESSACMTYISVCPSVEVFRLPFQLRQQPVLQRLPSVGQSLSTRLDQPFDHQDEHRNMHEGL